ncbi:MAG: FMN-dependent NADH-azoreductase [Lentisphaerae bacterium GWF2_44_16]|nr:MAG: FMN-dependent NADH-azoreductase [Lentisphaerae bacterium GWF2_44_16]
MAKLLYVESSPRKERSYSIAVAREFLKAYKGVHPHDSVETLDLWTLELPEFSGDAINAKYKIMHGEPHTAGEAEAWNKVVDVFERFKSADKYLFSIPMWNFGIPYKLKHFIDIINQPGLSFTFSPESGYKGLLSGRSAVVIYSRGGEYLSGPAAAMDFQKTYFERLLGFIGITDVKSIVIEPTLSGPELVKKAKKDAMETACRFAAGF